MNTILLVDDNIELLRLYERILSLKSKHMIAGRATSGEEAVRVYRDMIIKPDLVIMDVNMPGIDGITAARRIIKSDGKAKIMFATSEVINPDDIPVELSNALVLRKPFTVNDFLCAIKAASTLQVRARYAIA